jgi:hypothetical protein
VVVSEVLVVVQPGDGLAVNAARFFELEGLVEGVDDADQEEVSHFPRPPVKVRLVELNNGGSTARVLLLSSSAAFMKSLKRSGLIVGILSAVILK